MPHARIARIERVTSAAYRIPTDAPESDGTIQWDSTTLVVVHLTAEQTTGVGYAYCSGAATSIVDEVLAPCIRGTDALATTARFDAMVRAARNVGRPGVAASAISAVDVALWDCKARLLGVSLAALLPAARERIAAYGSGGFTSYDDARLRAQLGGWVHDDGCRAVKMKIGREPWRDVDRVRAAREAIGPEAELYVDANGAYERKQALRLADAFAELGVTWFEEPVSADDHDGLRLLRDRAPAGMRIAVGEYGYEPFYFRRLLEAGACDVLQADATRCGGVTGFLQVAALADAWNVPLSAHTAPSLHATLCCAAGRGLNVEYFHDHARIEHLLFAGARAIENGMLVPDRSALGLGLELRTDDAAPYAV
ncbi:MAG TPA: enolase C-terminal domain-like protein [Gemmatimonadaceae bacterium]|nr:enolase C-terminal domain-like protein [Gemmatimonadaceae bacterium]